MKDYSKILIVAVLLVLFFSLSVSASNTKIRDILAGSHDGDEVLDRVDTAFSFLLYKVFPLVGVLLLGIAGLVLAFGNAEGKTKVIAALGGIGVIALAPRFVAWIIDILS